MLIAGATVLSDTDRRSRFDYRSQQVRAALRRGAD
jgi:hypothetical protein